jgi:hypothetical protein
LDVEPVETWSFSSKEIGHKKLQYANKLMIINVIIYRYHTAFSEVLEMNASLSNIGIDPCKELLNGH